MSRSDQYQEWEKDFGEFLNAQESQPPKELSQKVFHFVATALSPSPGRVFLRLVAVVIVAGSVSLLICPQLGMGSYYSPVMHFFMKLGPIGCRAACSAFFMMSSILCACIVMRPEELRVLRETRFLSIASVSALGLGVFMCTTPDIILSAALTWFVGAVIGGIVSLEIGSRIRLRLIEYRYA